jgi:hypothetical protein
LLIRSITIGLTTIGDITTDQPPARTPTPRITGGIRRDDAYVALYKIRAISFSVIEIAEKEGGLVLQLGLKKERFPL